ncbi:AI-2E family transporter [Tautonia rosea]|uniref:AI-2E family transporter n=1 Tax=Tautonia rosea TaxID=2728037 RepID=UPI001473EEA3|nr:AI-2E family transporter [Tautonia rosea]
MADRTVRLQMNHPVIVTVLILAVIAFMYLAAEVLRPLALAVLFSMVLAPLASWLERRGIPRAVATGASVLVVLGALGGLGSMVFMQFGDLAEEVVAQSDEIKVKVRSLFQGQSPSAVGQVGQVVEEVTREVMEETPETDGDEPPNEIILSQSPASPGLTLPETSRSTLQGDPIIPVEVVDRPSIQDRFRTAVGPLLGPAAIFFLVLILTLFILLTRDNLNARLIQVIGTSHVSLTTRTLEEAGQRISRYLTIFSLYNAACGAILGLGLYLIGIPYAVLWGFLAAVLRFIPYVGPWTAFALPLAYSVTLGEVGDGWKEPLLVIALFGTLEIISNSILEPIIYGRTAGITAVGLLVMAMFWTWLWGPIGLLLSTPLTVCLAVLGKYVPALNVFATMLGEDVVLERHAHYYQRLLAHDSDTAFEVVETALEDGFTLERIFDEILIPALSRAESDLARSVIEESDEHVIWTTTRTILDDLEAREEDNVQADLIRPKHRKTGKVLGIASGNEADTMVLRMVQISLRPLGIPVEIVDASASPLEASEHLSGSKNQIVLLSYLPPVGLTSARYLVRRIKALDPKLPLWAGRWGAESSGEKARNRLTKMGADRIVFRVAEVKEHLPEALELLQNGHPKEPKPNAEATALP